MAGRYVNSDFVATVIEKNDIVSVVSKYVSLTRRGNNYWACCPFHLEKTPSFSIKEGNQFYKCFGCGEAGNVINFVQKLENVDFVHAVEILCKQSGLEMPTDESNEELKQKRKKLNTNLDILRLTCEFYQNNLTLPEAQVHQNYIAKRGIDDEMVKKFKIGASLDFDSLPRFLKSKGYTVEEMVDAGVAGLNEYGRPYDFYGKRLLFPIFNGLSEVVGFSGRDLSDNPEKAKYKNTPQTSLFNKSTIIYGFNFLRELKKNRSLDTIILVEGQMDVIACHQAGITNAVGCMGTAFTFQHARDLANLCKNIILCLDGDGAGANATYKAMTVLREANMNVGVVRLEGAKDPDEFIKKFGKEKFVDMLANSMNYMEFILIDLAKKYDLTKNNDKNNYINEALAFLSKLSTATEQEIYLNVLKEIVNVPVDALRKTLTGAKEPVKKETKYDEIELNENQFVGQAKELILASMLFKKIEIGDEFKDMFKLDDEYKVIYDFIYENNLQGKTINVSMLYSMFDIAPNSVWDKIINYNFPTDEVFAKFFKESITRLKISSLKQMKEEYKSALKGIDNLEKMYVIMAKIKEIDEEINKLIK